MKTTIFIIVLFIFSLSSGNKEVTGELALDQTANFVTGLHYIGTVDGVDQFITLTIPEEAAIGHVLNHPKDCFPPCGGGR